MKRYLHSFLAAAALAATTVSAGTSAFAAGYDDHDALQGAKEVKVAFDITAGGAQARVGGANTIHEKPRSPVERGRAPPIFPSFPGAAANVGSAERCTNKPR